MDTRYAGRMAATALLLCALGAAVAAPAGAPPQLTAATAPPASPGAAGMATVAGIDTNANGVRDDMEPFLLQHFGKKPQVLRAMSNLIIGLQSTMTATTLMDASRAHSMTLRATECLLAVKDQLTPDQSRDEKMIALLVNTPERSAAIAAHKERIGQQVFAMRELDEWEAMCNLRADLVDHNGAAMPRRE